MIVGSIQSVLYSLVFFAVMWIRIRPDLCNFAGSGSESKEAAHPDSTEAILFDVRIQCLCLLDPDPDPLVRGTDPAPDLDPSIIKQK
jgi:hypothetical protein